MKKLLAILAAVAVVAVAGTAMASGTANLTVQANITAACSVDAATLDFGTLDATVANASKTASTTVNVHCTKGTTPTLSTTNPVMTFGGDSIAYTLTIPTPPGASAGATQAVTVQGDIAANGFFMKTAGNYSATAVVSVLP